MYYPVYVTPYTGVWIEIAKVIDALGNKSVTPYTGVWIEIIKIWRMP